MYWPVSLLSRKVRTQRRFENDGRKSNRIYVQKEIITALDEVTSQRITITAATAESDVLLRVVSCPSVALGQRRSH